MKKRTFLSVIHTKTIFEAVMLLLIVVLSVGCSGGSAGEQDGEQTATENAGTGARDRTGGNEKGTSGGGDEQNDSVLSEEDINASSTKAEHTNDAAQADPDRTREKDMQETSKQGEKAADGETEGGEKGPDAKNSEEEKTGTTENDGQGFIPAADDDSAWANSFLLFLPRFEGGTEKDRVCEKTFDHIIIGEIDSKRSIEDYVEDIKAAGFDVDADYVDHNGEIEFHAYNRDGWYATVSYDIKTGKADIGCGFFEEEEEKLPEKYFPEDILSVLPMPETGVLSTGKTEDGYIYVLYEQVSSEDAQNYARSLKKAGFDSDVIEGQSEDQCWYNALGPNGLICDMQYADGIMMVGCDTLNVQ